MHADEPKAGSLFWAEIEALISGTSALGDPHGPIDFSGFVFPRHPGFSVVFQTERDVNFARARFSHDMVFGGSWNGNVDFSDAVFQRTCRFYMAAFGAPTKRGKVTLHRAVYRGDVTFFGGVRYSSLLAHSATFHGRLELGGSFHDVLFERCGFDGEFRTGIGASAFGAIRFEDCVFNGEVNTSHWSVQGPAAVAFARCEFREACVGIGSGYGTPWSVASSRFLKKIDPTGGRLENVSDYSRCVFLTDFDASGLSFKSHVTFAEARFEAAAHFARAVFAKGATFAGTSFFDRTDFSYCTFGAPEGPIAEPPPVADFAGSFFARPDAVRFLLVNNSVAPLRMRLLNSDVRSVTFDDVNWLERNGRLILQDELDLDASEDGATSAASYGVLATAYRRLTASFDAVGTYDRGEQTFWRAMEAKRRDPRERLATRLVTTAYRLLSGYGGSYFQALMVLVALLVVLSLLWSVPRVGPLVEVSATPMETVVSDLQAETAPAVPWWNWQRLKPGFVHTLEVVSFQKPYTHKSITTAGTLVRFGTLVLVPGQAALVLLALRRRFKR